MNTVLISLASNTPDKLRQMNNAFAELQEMGLVAASSSIYETVACGSIKSPNYLNAVVKIFTDTDHQELHNVLKTMEKAHGRTPESKLSPLPFKHPVAETKYEALSWSFKHEMWHSAEMEAIKRELGYPIVWMEG